MSFLAFLLLGLIAGAIAKVILPGQHNGGCITTMFLGVIGALVGGWLGNMLFDTDINQFWSLSSWALAIGGSVIVLFIWGAMRGRRKS